MVFVNETHPCGAAASKGKASHDGLPTGHWLRLRFRRPENTVSIPATIITCLAFLLLAVIWTAVWGISLGQPAVAEPKASKSDGPAQQQEKIERKGPPPGLPSVSGRHLDWPLKLSPGD
jgi:hypothetical protein